MSSIGIVWIFWVSGYLKKFDGPCGCRNVSFTSLVSLQTSSTQANHQFSSCKQVTNPAIDRGGISFFTRATLFSWKHQMMSKIQLPLCYLRLTQKSAVFSYQGLYVRVECDIPNYSVLSHNLHCYNTQSKQQVCCYMPNRTTDVVSLAGHCMAFASLHEQLVT